MSSDQALLISLDEGANRLSISRRLLQEIVYNGRLPSVKLGRCRRIAIADLEAYVERLRGEATPHLETKATTGTNSGRRGGQRVHADHRATA